MADKKGKPTTTTSPFVPPKWAGKPPVGLHLDVTKSGSVVEKLMIDQKPYYLFGRNKDVCDFPLDHTSCSRVHSALIFHKHLQRPFLMDLKSTHGTFIGNIRLDCEKPTQVQIDSVIHFGASTRTYTLREKPTLPSAMQSAMSKNDQNVGNEDTEDGEGSKGGFLGLPESDTDLKDLTDFNTAHNKRLSSIAIEESAATLPKLKRRRLSQNVSFKDGYDVINPEDIDPSVGKFRNMVQTSIIVQTKDPRHGVKLGSMTESITKRMNSFAYKEELYADLPAAGADEHDIALHSVQAGSRVTAAPDVDGPDYVAVHRQEHENTLTSTFPQEAPKKKYAKEAWPGKKHGSSLLM